MRDTSLLLLNATTATTATATGTGKLIGADLVPATWKIDIGAITGTDTPTVVVTIEGSNTLGSGYETLASKTFTATGVDYATVFTNYKYRRAVATITGTNPSIATIKVARESAGQDKDF
jgi:hypothetical protein